MLDIYDDKSGLLQQKLGSAKIKELLKHGEIISESDARKLPDRLFALVLVTPDGRMRKYACNDPANTVVSTIYFLENYANLPPEAVKTAATNLVAACNTYDLAVPPQLEKLAIMGAAMNLGFGAMATRDVAKKGREKVYGTLAQSGVPVPGDPYAGWKTASVYVESNDLPVSAYRALEVQALTVPRLKTATFDDIGVASQYYTDNSFSWSPEQKVGFCRILLDRAVKLGMASSLPEEVQLYGKKDPGTPEQISSILDTRKPFFKTASAYADYLCKVASIADLTGDAFAAKLASIERQNHLASRWSSELPDPWMVVFGLCKQAEYIFRDKEDVITDKDLLHLPSHRTELLETFDPELVTALLEDPLSIFDSLPLDHKRVIMRIVKKEQK